MGQMSNSTSNSSPNTNTNKTPRSQAAVGFDLNSPGTVKTPLSGRSGFLDPEVQFEFEFNPGMLDDNGNVVSEEVQYAAAQSAAVAAVRNTAANAGAQQQQGGAQGGGGGSSGNTTEAEAEDTEVEDEEEEGEGGAECILLYRGHKMFWRTRESIDVYLYLHPAEGCIEVVAFDLTYEQPTSRLYLDENAAVQTFEENIQAEVKLRREKMISEQRFQSSVPKYEDMYEEAKRLCIITYILSRLELSSAAKYSGIEPRTLSFAQLSQDTAAGLNPVLTQAPDGPSFRPARVTQSYHATEEVIADKLQALKMEHDQLQSAVETAARASLNVDTHFD
jgi:hypothetical protein